MLSLKPSQAKCLAWPGLAPCYFYTGHSIKGVLGTHDPLHQLSSPKANDGPIRCVRTCFHSKLIRFKLWPQWPENVESLAVALNRSIFPKNNWEKIYLFLTIEFAPEFMTCIFETSYLTWYFPLSMLTIRMCGTRSLSLPWN